MTYIDYTPNGQLIKRTVHDRRNTTYLVFDADVLYFFNVQTNTWANAPTNYKREADEIRLYPSNESIGFITKLTKDTLRLRRAKWDKYYPSGNYIDLEEVYTR